MWTEAERPPRWTAGRLAVDEDTYRGIRDQLPRMAAITGVRRLINGQIATGRWSAYEGNGSMETFTRIKFATSNLSTLRPERS